MNSVSSMLEIVLPKLNQIYEIESIDTILKYYDETIEIDGDLIFPSGSFIKISGARYNNGIYEIVESGEVFYKLDRPLAAGAERATVSPLSIPFGLLVIVKEMCVAADEINNSNVNSISEGDTTITYNEGDIFKKFSRRLAIYRKLKTL